MSTKEQKFQKLIRASHTKKIKQGHIGSVAENYSIVTEQLENIDEGIKNTAKGIDLKIDSRRNILGKAFPKQSPEISSIFTNVLDIFKTSFTDFGDGIKRLFNIIGSPFKGLKLTNTKKVSESIKNALSKIWKHTKSNFLTRAISKTFVFFKDGWKTASTSMGDFFANGFKEIGNYFMEKLEFLMGPLWDYIITSASILKKVSRGIKYLFSKDEQDVDDNLDDRDKETAEPIKGRKSVVKKIVSVIKKENNREGSDVDEQEESPKEKKKNLKVKAYESAVKAAGMVGTVIKDSLAVGILWKARIGNVFKKQFWSNMLGFFKGVNVFILGYMKKMIIPLLVIGGGVAVFMLFKNMISIWDNSKLKQWLGTHNIISETLKIMSDCWKSMTDFFKPVTKAIDWLVETGKQIKNVFTTISTFFSNLISDPIGIIKTGLSNAWEGFLEELRNFSILDVISKIFKWSAVKASSSLDRFGKFVTQSTKGTVGENVGKNVGNAVISTGTAIFRGGMAAGTAVGLSGQNTKQNLSQIAKELKAQGLNDEAVAASLGQVMKESKGKRQEENLNYSVQGLRKTFGTKLSGYSDAQLDSIRKDPRQLAELLYGTGSSKGKELGNTTEGDAYKYRGRGYIQLTGKANYAKASKAIGMGNALIDNPDLVNDDPVVAAKVVAWFLAEGRKRAAKKLGVDVNSADLETQNAIMQKTVNGSLSLSSGKGKDDLTKAELYSQNKDVQEISKGQGTSASVSAIGEGGKSGGSGASRVYSAEGDVTKTEQQKKDDKNKAMAKVATPLVKTNAYSQVASNTTKVSKPQDNIPKSDNKLGGGQMIGINNRV